MLLSSRVAEFLVRMLSHCSFLEVSDVGCVSNRGAGRVGYPGRSRPRKSSRVAQTRHGTKAGLIFTRCSPHDGVFNRLDFLDSNVFNSVISGDSHFVSTSTHSTEGGVTRPLSHRSPVHILKPALTCSLFWTYKKRSQVPFIRYRSSALALVRGEVRLVEDSQPQMKTRGGCGVA
jgi:hypothetical protein